MSSIKPRTPVPSLEVTLTDGNIWKLVAHCQATWETVTRFVALAEAWPLSQKKFADRVTSELA